MVRRETLEVIRGWRGRGERNTRIRSPHHRCHKSHTAVYCIIPCCITRNHASFLGILFHDSTYSMCSCIMHKTLCRMRTAFFLGKRHPNTRRSRATAPAHLEPPKGSGLGLGLGLGLGSGLGLGWSGSTCKVGIDGTRPAHSFVQDAAAHSGHLLPRIFFSPPFSVPLPSTSPRLHKCRAPIDCDRKQSEKVLVPFWPTAALPPSPPRGRLANCFFYRCSQVYWPLLLFVSVIISVLDDFRLPASSAVDPRRTSLCVLTN